MGNIRLENLCNFRKDKLFFYVSYIAKSKNLVLKRFFSSVLIILLSLMLASCAFHLPASRLPTIKHPFFPTNYCVLILPTGQDILFENNTVYTEIILNSDKIIQSQKKANKK